MDRRRFFKWALLGGATVGGGLFAARQANAGNPYYDGPQTPHFDGTEFYNPNGTPPGSFRDLLRWQLGGGKTAWPESYPSPFAGEVPEARVTGNELRVTMVGHATMLIQTAGLNILTDPVFSERASPVSFAGPKRINPPGVALGDLPPIDIVLVSHNHYDHLDIASLRRLVLDHNPLIIAPLGNDTIIKKDIATARVTVGDWGDVVQINDDVRIHLEPMHHWSARGANDRRMALWAAMVIDAPSGKTYFIGDTGYHDGINYRAAAAKHGGFRLSILPIGAYEPRWFMKGQHQNPAEAVQGFMESNSQFAIGHHWGVFKLTNEGIEAPLEALAAALDQNAIEPDRFRPLRPGERWDVPSVPV